ncbi:DivIVA domain-containing protein [Nocardioides sp. Bht2]|uniref:DivIVA domain-containing protein n=1 Tax=Nocardioides sp. Bht2 TaxID=3392297 RepID=UPI0039B61585
MWFFAALAVLALGAIAVVASGKGAPMREVTPDRPPLALEADTPITGQELREVRFSTAVRGYRMDEVDALLARLATQLEATSPKPIPGIVDETPRG